MPAARYVGAWAIPSAVITRHAGIPSRSARRMISATSSAITTRESGHDTMGLTAQPIEAQPAATFDRAQPDRQPREMLVRGIASPARCVASSAVDRAGAHERQQPRRDVANLARVCPTRPPDRAERVLRRLLRPPVIATDGPRDSVRTSAVTIEHFERGWASGLHVDHHVVVSHRRSDPQHFAVSKRRHPARRSPCSSPGPVALAAVQAASTPSVNNHSPLATTAKSSRRAHAFRYQPWRSSEQAS